MNYKTTESYFIPKKIESQNITNKQHYWKYVKIKNAWLDAVCFFMRSGNASGYRTIRITSVRKLLLDYGNLVGGAKPLMDAIVKMGHLVDDSPKHSHQIYEQRKKARGEEEGTLIEFVEPVLSKKERVLKLLKEQPDISTRKAAKIVGCANSFVHKMKCSLK